MKWCKYHGLLTPASLTSFPMGSPPHLTCGYRVGTALCTSAVYEVDIFEIDMIVENHKLYGMDELRLARP